MAEPKTRLWSQEVAEADPLPEEKPTYEFSNGRKFYETGYSKPQPIDPKTNE